MKLAVLAAFPLLLLTSCGRYADFQLPPPEASGPRGPFIWEADAAPIMSSGDWDTRDVLNPSIVRWQGHYLNLYSGYDGLTWHTGIARSQDGVHWISRRKILSEGAMAANGATIVFQGAILHWYETGSPLRLSLAKSSDGTTWTKLGQVFPTGPRGSFDERAAADPYVIERSGSLYMFYLGQDRAWRQRLGVARSADGIHWDKLRANPVLELGGPGEFDERGLGEPAVWTSGGAYWMLYTGRDAAEHRRLGLARSTDGIAWSKIPNFVIEGAQAWDSKVICDPEVELQQDGTIRVWFGGGDVASPDQNLHGQIGIGRLRSAQ